MESSFKGRRGLIVGVANKNSLAWAIADEINRQGGELAFTYMGESMEKRVRPLAESVSSEIIMPMDVRDDIQMGSVMEAIKGKWGKLDFLLHAVAFANREDLMGEFLETPRQGFIDALEVSAFSLVALSREASELLAAGDGGSVLTLTYFGSEKVIPHYNVMGVAKAALEASVRYLAVDLGSRGVRINALSAGPAKTLSAKGIRDFNQMLHVVEERSPMKRNITHEEVAKTAAFLLSGASSGITGEVLHVDAGYNIMGM